MAPPRRSQSRASRALAGVLLCASLAPWSPGPARAQSAPADAYEQTIAEAVREFSAGRWSEARALFQRAHELSPNARTLRGLGMTAYELRLYAEAIDELGRALTDAQKPLTEEHRTQVQGLIDAAKRFVGRYRLTLSPPGAQLQVDGKRARFDRDGALMLDAGPHEVRADAAGYQTASLRLRVEGGEHTTLELTLQPEAAAAPAAVPVTAPAGGVAPPTAPAPAGAAPAAEAPATASQPASSADPGATAAEASGASTLRTVAWIMVAGAGAFAATSGIFWLVGEGQYSDLEDTCRTSCTLQQIDDSGVETSDTLTNVFLGLALVSGATGLVMFAIDAAAGGEHDALAVGPAPGGVRVTGSF